MSHLALVSIAFGALIIIIRGPLLVAPASTLEVYRSLIRNNARVRVLAICGVWIGLAMIAAASSSDGTGAWVIWIWGWLVVSMSGLFALPFASAYRRFAEVLLDLMENSDLPRPVGAIATALDALLIYLGLFVF
jgi:hypothetical protein